MEKYDCIVLGGGPAGMMAALSASKLGKKVLLIEKNTRLGKKLLLTGNGRCNITHDEDRLKDFASNYGKSGDFLLSTFSIFGPKETQLYFNKLGIALSVDENGKVFPQSNSAEKVLLSLEKKLKDGIVEVRCSTELKDLIVNGREILEVVVSNGEKIKGSNYVFALGGKSFSFTGSDGSGFDLLKKIGHSISPLYPGLCPLVLEKSCSQLSGLSLQNVSIKFLQNNKTIYKNRGDVLFAGKYITGPCILDASNVISPYYTKGGVAIVLDIFPEKDEVLLKRKLLKLLEQDGKKSVKNILKSLVPERLVHVLLEEIEIDKEKSGIHLTKKEFNEIVYILKNFLLNSKHVLGFDGAMVTLGGVELKEIDSRTMKSRLFDNLYFAGEIIDLAGFCGGYNLQMCWSTGYVAGLLK